MRILNQDIIKAFWQQGDNNCASIALIKASIETFGLNNVFSIENIENSYLVKLRNGDTVTFTEQNLLHTIQIGNFQPSQDNSPSKQSIYEEIRKYAQLCYAVMVAQYNAKNNLNDFDTALLQLSNGANARFISQYLGLENYCSYVFKGNSQYQNLIAWQHLPWLKHVVYKSQNKYDYYGSILNNVGRFPTRIQFFNSEKLSFTAQESTFSELNFVNISRFGTFQDTGKVRSSPQDIDRIIQYLRDNNIKRLLLHFHGGLISENRGMKSAEEFYNNYNDFENTLPVSIVWETGFLEALPETFRRIIQTDDLLRTLIIKVLKFFASRFNIDLSILDTGFLPPSLENIAYLVETKTDSFTEETLESLFSETYPEESITDVIDGIYSEMQSITTDEVLTDEEFERIVNDESEEISNFINPKILWYSAKIAKRCIVRFINKRGHGVLPTIIEESCREIYLDDLGTEIWQVMKNQAKSMWNSNNGRIGNNQYAGRYLFDKIVENFTSDELEVSIVAHSAGAVATCEWIKVVSSDEKYKSFKFKNIVFLAPACRCELFKETVMKHKDTYSIFKMITMDDYYESKDNLIQLPVLKHLYTRSLLYLISGILEGRKAKDADAYILGLHRHIRKSKPYSTVAMLNEISDFLMLPDNNGNNLILSISDSSAFIGRRTGAKHHGGFVKDKLVIESIKHLVRENASL
jgi:hypothetical protein